MLKIPITGLPFRSRETGVRLELMLPLAARDDLQVDRLLERVVKTTACGGPKRNRPWPTISRLSYLLWSVERPTAREITDSYTTPVGTISPRPKPPWQRSRQPALR